MAKREAVKLSEIKLSEEIKKVLAFRFFVEKIIESFCTENETLCNKVFDEAKLIKTYVFDFDTIEIYYQKKYDKYLYYFKNTDTLCIVNKNSLTENNEAWLSDFRNFVNEYIYIKKLGLDMKTLIDFLLSVAFKLDFENYPDADERIQMWLSKVNGLRENLFEKLDINIIDDINTEDYKDKK